MVLCYTRKDTASVRDLTNTIGGGTQFSAFIEGVDNLYGMQSLYIHTQDNSSSFTFGRSETTAAAA